MMKRKLVFMCLVGILNFGIPFTGHGQESASFKLRRWSLSNGGGLVNSENFSLKESALGGLAVGKSSSDSFVLNLGGMLITTVEDSNLAQSILPTMFELQQNYPNPFNPETTIQYSLPKGSEVTIRIFNILGHLVKTFIQGYQHPGNYRLIWDGTNNHGENAASGTYYYQIKTDGFIDVQKMTLVR